MLLTDTIEIHITARTVNHYREKGYIIPTKYSEKSKKEIINSSIPIVVKIEDLPNNSHIKIKYKCDNCGKEFITEFCYWNNTKYKELGDLCKNCAAKIKLPQAMRDKYGYDNSAKVDFIIEKKKQTNLERYGNEWAIASSKVKSIITEKFMEKYNTINPMQNEEIKQKAMKTNNERYGGNCPLCNPIIKEKSKATCLEKYGVNNAFQSKEVQAKARKTLYENGTVPSSKAEKELCNILINIYGEDNCFPSYPLEEFSLDCLVIIDGNKIDFEYDGIYWHKNRDKKDRARNGVLMKKGYRIIRIKANNQDTMPSASQIKEAVNYLLKENHHLTFIDMNT